MDPAVIPDFLTVEEAARVLRIGRTTAYQQAHRWLDTGCEGLPAEWVGGSIRVPRVLFEQHFNVRITAIPSVERRRRPQAGTATEPEAQSVQDIPRSKPSRRRKSDGTAQGGLPFAG